MKVLHFSAHDGGTGGGLSATRIHRGLLSRGLGSRLCVAQPTLRPEGSFTPRRSLGLKLAEKVLRPADRWLTDRWRGRYESGVNTGFIGYDIGAIVAEEAPDLVHLHWLAGDSFRFSSLANLPVPVIWRLPDMWTFCAIEQYQADPKQYRLEPDRSGAIIDLPRWAWNNKARTYSTIGELIVACPSQWLADEARTSRLLRDRRVEVVRTGCDSALFAPVDRASARAAFELPLDAAVILVGADSLALPRKGMDLFAAALHQLPADGPAPLVVSFGSHPVDTAWTGAPVRSVHLGRVTDRSRLAQLYSAADLFVAPSRMENLANTVLESMACGTPVAAFDIGGMPDVIEHRRNGYLAKPFDTADLAEGMDFLLRQSGAPERRAAARAKVSAEFSVAGEIDAYIALYETLLANSASRRAA